MSLETYNKGGVIGEPWFPYLVPLLFVSVYICQKKLELLLNGQKHMKMYW